MQRAGPFHFLLLLCTTSLTLLLPLCYAAALAAAGCWVGWLGFEWVTDLALRDKFGLQELRPGILIVLAGITWIFMLRPFLPRTRREQVCMQLTSASQPRLFELVEAICSNLRVAPPQEIWLDTTLGTHSRLRNGVWGVAAGELHLYIGMPLIATLTAHELAAVLVRELALNSCGLGSTFSHMVRELNGWFYVALHDRDPWETELRKARKKDNRSRRALRDALRVWMATAKLPFALLMITSRIIGLTAQARLESRAEKAGMSSLGKEAWRAVDAKCQILSCAWQMVQEEIARGMAQHRLPENVPLLIVRHVSRLADKAVTRPEHESCETLPSCSPVMNCLLPELPPKAPGTAIVSGFVELARQATCFYYQHELGIKLHEHQLVADEESIHQRLKEDPAMQVISRYFQSLAHPERSLCGLAATHVSNPGRETLIAEILRRRGEMREWGGCLRSTLLEWNLAWQRRRDLEAAALLSLAGLPVSRIQFGSMAEITPASLRNEAARQRMLMDHLEATLTQHEAKIECRFSAALGLLWWAESKSLPANLAARVQMLPAWVSVYEALAASMTCFRELLTVFFAFQTLGARHMWQEDMTQSFTALQTVVPKMTGLVRQILPPLDGACHPNPPGTRPVPLADYLLPNKLPLPMTISMNPGAAADRRILSVKMAGDAARAVTPFVDRYLQLYHEAFAWLAETAELSESHFVGPLGQFHNCRAATMNSYDAARPIRQSFEGAAP